jgi:hypothetical protein
MSALSMFELIVDVYGLIVRSDQVLFRAFSQIYIIFRRKLMVAMEKRNEIMEEISHQDSSIWAFFEYYSACWRGDIGLDC